MLGSPRCFKDVSSLFQPNFKGFLGRFKGVSRKFQWCLEEVSRAFQRSYLDFFKPKEARKFQGCFEKISRVFQGSLRDFSRKFQGSFTEVSRWGQNGTMTNTRGDKP